MIIRFDEMDLSVLPQFKGGEKEFRANMFFDGTNRAFRGILVPGSTIGMHTHEDSCEIIFILSGNGTIVEQKPGTDQVTEQPVSAGDCLYCPKGHAHSLQNLNGSEDLVFYAAVAMQ